MKKWKQIYSNEYGLLKVENDYGKIQALKDRWDTALGKRTKNFFLDFFRNPDSHSEMKDPFWEKLPFWGETCSKVDFRGINLEQCEFHGLRGGELLGVDFSYANLNACKFEDSFFWVLLAYQTSFAGTYFCRTSLVNPKVYQSSFQNCCFDELKIHGENSNIEATDFSGSIFRNCEIEIHARKSFGGNPTSFGFWNQIDFSNSHIENTRLQFDNLAVPQKIDDENKYKVNEYEAIVESYQSSSDYSDYIKYTDLDFTNIRMVDSVFRILEGKWGQLLFKNAYLNEIDWKGKEFKFEYDENRPNQGRLFGLIGADFEGAHLVKNNLSYMHLSQVNFKDVMFQKVNLKECNLAGTDFRGVKPRWLKRFFLRKYISNI